MMMYKGQFGDYEWREAEENGYLIEEISNTVASMTAKGEFDYLDSCYSESNESKNAGGSSSSSSSSSNCSITSSSSSGKFEDPLMDSIVRISLQKVQLTGTELIEMSVKELNRRLSNCPSYVVSKLKQCRRTLKNRGYAKNCRIKRIAAKNHLEKQNDKLKVENFELRQRNKLLMDQLNRSRSSRQSPPPIVTINKSFAPETCVCGLQHEEQHHQALAYPCVNEDDILYNNQLTPELDYFAGTEDFVYP